MNDQPSIKLNFPLAVVGLMMQVVDSNGQLEESELQRMGLAAQELLDIQPTEVGNLITKAHPC